MLNEEIKRFTTFVIDTHFVDSDAGRLLLVVNDRSDRPGRLVEILPEAQLIGLGIVATDFACVARDGTSL